MDYRFVLSNLKFADLQFLVTADKDVGENFKEAGNSRYIYKNQMPVNQSASK